TIMVGLALTLSLSFGGLWLVRKKASVPGSSVSPLMVLVAVVGLGLVGGAAVWANGAPPFRQPQPQPFQIPKPPPPFPAVWKGEGVKIEFVQQGDAIRLILTSKQKAALKDNVTKEK